MREYSVPPKPRTEGDFSFIVREGDDGEIWVYMYENQGGVDMVIAAFSPGSFAKFSWCVQTVLLMISDMEFPEDIPQEDVDAA